jgi:hypothetical protein
VLDILNKWDELKKALSHKEAIASSDISLPKPDVPTEVHPDHLPKVKYGRDDSDETATKFTPSIGMLKLGGKKYAVRPATLRSAPISSTRCPSWSAPITCFLSRRTTTA